jgi:hypothetical protein
VKDETETNPLFVQPSDAIKNLADTPSLFENMKIISTDWKPMPNYDINDFRLNKTNSKAYEDSKKIIQIFPDKVFFKI